MHPIHITIAGMGPRGLSVLERIAEHAHLLPASVRLQIDIVDPRACGEGSHPSTQPEHLLTNTLASQVTMFAPASIVGGAGGVSLAQWAHMAGYRRVGSRFMRVPDSTGATITAFDHLPRSLLGAYLSWVYSQVVARLPPHVSVVHRRARVVDFAGRANGFDVVLDDGHTHRADYLFLTTGHGKRKPAAEDRRLAAFAARHAARNASLAYFASPYPIDNLARIPATATVAVQGFGLTAHDVISALTLGRGGSYTERDGKLHYVRSGSEPRIRLFSRNCLPFATRGVNQKGLTGRHHAHFFTPGAVAALRTEARARTGDARLDFRGAVLPLIVKEMAYAYRGAAQGRQIDAAGFEPSVEELDAIAAILWPLDSLGFDSLDAFRDFFDAMLRSDLAQAGKGNLDSPVKAATDVLRDTREALRAAVEHAGLTPASHQFFVEEFNPVTNRVAFGPPTRRNLEYLALREAGVIDLAGGPGARLVADDEQAQFAIATNYPSHEERSHADVLVIARLDPYSPLTDDSRLTENLLARGAIRPYRNGAYHPGGIDIDEDMHPVDAHGNVQRRVWAIGFLVEGPHFYTHALPRPLMASRQTSDAERCVLALFDDVSAAVAGRPAVPADVLELDA